MYKKYHLLLVFVLPFVYSCVPLTEVHNYATTSVEALNKINSVDYTFKDYCRQDCELQQLRAGEIQPNFNCNCTEMAVNADDAIEKIRLTLRAYLVAVAQLSNNKSFSYDVSGLTQAVQKSQLLGLNEQQISIANKAGNFIATAATALYRKKKLKQYLGEADTLFQNLTETFIYLVDNRLRAQLKFQYNARVPNLKQILDNTNDRGVKQMAIKLYLNEQEYFTKHNNLINAYVALLKEMQKGYHELYIHRFSLGDVTSKDVLKKYADDLQYLIDSLN